MRKRLCVALGVFALLAVSQTRADFVPPFPASHYGPANFPINANQIHFLGSFAGNDYYNVTPVNITVTLPTGTGADVVAHRCAYALADAAFYNDIGFDNLTRDQRLAAVNWFVANVNPLWGY